MSHLKRFRNWLGYAYQACLAVGQQLAAKRSRAKNEHVATPQIESKAVPAQPVTKSSASTPSDSEGLLSVIEALKADVFVSHDLVPAEVVEAEAQVISELLAPTLVRSEVAPKPVETKPVVPAAQPKPATPILAQPKPVQPVPAQPKPQPPQSTLPKQTPVVNVPAPEKKVVPPPTAPKNFSPTPAPVSSTPAQVSPTPAPVPAKPVQPQPPKPPVTPSAPVNAKPASTNGNGNAASVNGKAPSANGTSDGSTPEGNGKYDPSRINEQTAQRLARLLISEIKLYYKSKTDGVEQTENLYDLLKEPIDKSRQHYRRRIGKEAIASMPDYFHGELVKSLCAGDASRLGPNYQA